MEDEGAVGKDIFQKHARAKLVLGPKVSFFATIKDMCHAGRDNGEIQRKVGSNRGSFGLFLENSVQCIGQFACSGLRKALSPKLGGALLQDSDNRVCHICPS